MCMKWEKLIYDYSLVGGSLFEIAMTKLIELKMGGSEYASIVITTLFLTLQAQIQELVDLELW